MKNLLCILAIVVVFAIICCHTDKSESNELTKAQADSIANSVYTTEVDSDDLMQADWQSYSRPLWDEDIP